MIDLGLVAPDIEPMLSPIYDGGVVAKAFEIPLDVAAMLSEDIAD